MVKTVRSPTGSSFARYPNDVNRRTALLSGTANLNFPLLSDTVPRLPPFTRIETPGIGSPFSSATEPVTCIVAPAWICCPDASTFNSQHTHSKRKDGNTLHVVLALIENFQLAGFGIESNECVLLRKAFLQTFPEKDKIKFDSFHSFAKEEAERLRPVENHPKLVDNRPNAVK